MQIVIETEIVITKVTNIKKAKKRWKQWKKIYDCKKQTILMKCFEQIVFENFENLVKKVIFWCIFECEIDYLLAKKKYLRKINDDNEKR